MKRLAFPRAQRGATLIVGLIMLVLITLMVTTAFMISNTNLRAVGNMQFRNEVIAAANLATEDVLGSLLSGGSSVVPAGGTITVDLNNDGKTDYSVVIATPTCIRSDEVIVPAPPGSGSSATLGLAPGLPPTYNTVWDIDAKVTDATSGAAIRVRQGTRVMLSQVQKTAVCP